MTASAVCSLSLDPVQLLVCVSTRLPTHAALLESQRFAVNVLGEEDAWLARRFATPGIDKFAGLAVDDRSGAPVLVAALAHFTCDVHERLPGGDHSIFVGSVVDCAHDATRTPLVYFGSSFGCLRPPDPHLHDALAWEASMRF
jgi:flavin reductase (DIM6/NTAB) family NADH-FMN oxidoreductase RutF